MNGAAASPQQRIGCTALARDLSRLCVHVFFNWFKLGGRKELGRGPDAPVQGIKMEAEFCGIQLLKLAGVTIGRTCARRDIHHPAIPLRLADSGR